MRNNKEKIVGSFYKVKLVTGKFTINDICGNSLKNEGVKYPFPLSEQLADILTEELNYVFDVEDLLSDDDEFTGKKDYAKLISVVDISAFKVISELMKIRNNCNNFVFTKEINIDSALEFDSLLKVDIEDKLCLYSGYMKRAKEYLEKYNVILPLPDIRNNNGNLIDDEFLFREFLNKRIMELSRPEKVALVHMFNKLKGFSITLLFLWLSNVIDENDLANAFIDSLYNFDSVTDLDVENLDLYDIDVMESVLADKLYLLKLVLDTYIEDVVRIMPN